MWVLLWVLLVLGSLAVFALLARSLWRKSVVLGRELAVASERFGAINDQLEELDTDEIGELAVFAVPLTLRQDREWQRIKRERARRRAYRRMLLNPPR